MKILKTMVGLADKPQLVRADTIRYDGKLWIVPKWLSFPAEKCSRPERIVRIDHLPHQETDRNEQDYPVDFILNVPIPTAAFRGPVDEKTAAEYEIHFSPDIKIPVSDKRIN
jgi:hypothetical protein